MDGAAMRGVVMDDQDPLDLTVKDSHRHPADLFPTGYRHLPPRDSGRRSAGDHSDSDHSSYLESPAPSRHPSQSSSLATDPSYIPPSPPSASAIAGVSLVDDRPRSTDRSDSGDSSKNGTRDRRAASQRPFKMYSLMDPLVYGSVLNSSASGVGVSASGLGPTTSGISSPLTLPPSLYDSSPSGTSPSPSPGLSGLGMSSMVSYIMQKRRRHEARNKEAASPSTASSSGAAAPTISDGGDSDDPDGIKMKIVPEEKKDEAYRERRRKNNEAAKRSRDARRQKEEEIALRAAFLEQENLKLRAQVAILKNETAKLHYLLYNRV